MSNGRSGRPSHREPSLAAVVQDPESPGFRGYSWPLSGYVWEHGGVAYGYEPID